MFSLALACTLILSKPRSDSLESLFATFDVLGTWHQVLVEGFQKCEHSWRVLLASNLNDLVALNVEGNELVGCKISLYKDLIVVSITHDLESLVVVACPEEGNVAEGHHLSKHVEGSVRPLVHGYIVMLDSGLLSAHPVRETGDVSSCINVFDCGLKEWVNNYSSLSIKLDVTSTQELGCWQNSYSDYHNVSQNFTAVV